MRAAAFAVFALVLARPFLVSALVGGDCTPSGGTYTLTTNADLDALRAECKRILGNVFIQCSPSDPITNLEVFQYVEEISGYLYIDGCAQLTSLDGFRRLKYIYGDSMYTYPNGDEGYAFVLTNNIALRSLSGLQNVSAIMGQNRPGTARIRITGNSDLCYVNTVQWQYLLTSDYKRLFDVRDGQSSACDVRICDLSCSCGNCFGPDTENCQGTCSSSDNEERDVIILVVFLSLLTVCVLVLVFMYLTNRCGCRLTCGKKFWQVGTLRPDASQSKLRMNQTADDPFRNNSHLIEQPMLMATTDVDGVRSRSTRKVAPTSLPPLKMQPMRN